MAETKKKVAPIEQTYKKQQLLESETFKANKDLLSVVLDDASQYSMAEIRSAIAKAKKERI